jgi:hypothetical protein
MQSAFSSSCSSPEILFAVCGKGHAGGGLWREAWADGDGAYAVIAAANVVLGST